MTSKKNLIWCMFMLGFTCSIESMELSSSSDDESISDESISVGWQPGSSLDLTPDILPHELAKIRSCGIYTPEQVDDPDARLTWIIIHGTWGHKNTSFYKVDDQTSKKQSPNYGYIKDAASWYAERERTELELFFFTWAGEWSSQSRLLASYQLERFLRKFEYLDENNKLILLCHSHGCNVANFLTHLLGAEYPVHLLIYFGWPLRKEDHYQPMHYEQLFYFYSKEDPIALLGRLKERGFFKHLHKIKKLKLKNRAWRMAKGICKQKLTKIMRSCFCKIAGSSLKELEDSVSSCVEQLVEENGEDGTTFAVFQTHFDNKSARYLSIHSQLIDLVQFLPTIFEQVLDNPAIITMNSAWYLQVNFTKQGKKAVKLSPVTLDVSSSSDSEDVYNSSNSSESDESDSEKEETSGHCQLGTHRVVTNTADKLKKKSKKKRKSSSSSYQDY